MSGINGLIAVLHAEEAYQVEISYVIIPILNIPEMNAIGIIPFLKRTLVMKRHALVS